MKLKFSFAYLLCALLLFTSCDEETCETLEGTPSINFVEPTIKDFAPDDGSRELSGQPQTKIYKLLQKVDPKIAEGLGSVKIKPEEYEEIKTFTSDLVKEYAGNDRAVFITIFKWVVKNLKYKHVYEDGTSISNDPYPVFKTRYAICQGFSNLMQVMLESQGIPTLNVNGEYVGVGGHAWNYVLIEGRKWYVCDATNNKWWDIKRFDSYGHLVPFSIDANIYEDDKVICNYKECEINVDSIKSIEEEFTVPFSALGFKITSLSPSHKVSEKVKHIYIGKNIRTLGEYYVGLQHNALGLQAAYVEEGNTHLESFSGVVYKKNGKEYQIYYVPNDIKSLELKPMIELGKNTIFGNKGLEEVYIPRGTKKICAYAFEKCPQLHKAYIPEDTEVDERAFYDVHPDFTIVRGDYTGIDQVTI